MIRTKNRAISREEEVELQRSNQKVKNARHDECSASHEGSPHNHGSIDVPHLDETSSFRDKHLGEIPGAYNQAFAFEKKNGLRNRNR